MAPRRKQSIPDIHQRNDENDTSRRDQMSSEAELLNEFNSRYKGRDTSKREFLFNQYKEDIQSERDRRNRNLSIAEARKNTIQSRGIVANTIQKSLNKLNKDKQVTNNQVEQANGFDYDALKEFFRKNAVTGTFTKRTNGMQRNMFCTANWELIDTHPEIYDPNGFFPPTGVGAKGGQYWKRKNIILVWDLVVLCWRSFTLDSYEINSATPLADDANGRLIIDRVEIFNDTMETMVDTMVDNDIDKFNNPETFEQQKHTIEDKFVLFGKDFDGNKAIPFENKEEVLQKYYILHDLWKTSKEYGLDLDEPTIYRTGGQSYIKFPYKNAEQYRELLQEQFEVRMKKS